MSLDLKIPGLPNGLSVAEYKLKKLDPPLRGGILVCFLGHGMKSQVEMGQIGGQIQQCELCEESWGINVQTDLAN